jgi:hypothetical protein
MSVRNLLNANRHMNVTLHIQKTSYKLNVDPSSSIRDFRQLVQTQTGIPISQQILEVEVKDEIAPMKEGTLEENRMKEGCKIFLSVISREVVKTKEVTKKSNESTKHFSITREMFETWDCDELCTSLEEMGYSKDTIEKCREQEVDGLSLLECSYNDLAKDIGIKVGPAKKLTILVKKVKNAVQINGKKESKENTKGAPKIGNQDNKEVINKKPHSGGTKVHQDIQQDIWTNKMVMKPFTEPKDLKEHIRKLFDKNTTLTELNISSPCFLNLFPRQTNWRRGSNMHFQSIGSEQYIDNIDSFEYIPLVLIFVGLEIEDEGAKWISKSLEVNKTLTSLTLGSTSLHCIHSLGNSIRDKGAQCIGKALALNTTLTTMNLGSTLLN